jgi:lipopolysaccharide/colanic/teichoic acid biosynthesis glycosyltransferase
MKAKLVRLFWVFAIMAVVVGAGYSLRLLMISELSYHSFWHYVTRFVLVMAVTFAVILLIQLLTAVNPAESLGAEPVTEPDFKLSNLCKRVVDILLSIALLTALFPILVLVSLLIFILEGYPVFYISQRYISLDQCVFILKFRTMVRDATSPKYRLRERFMRDGFLDIPLDCEVYTPFGRFLERTQIVEILQLFNVLLHGMSLIGNRPLPRENVLLLQKFPGWERRFGSPAGLTGLSQVVGKQNQDPEDRLRLEGMYTDLYRKREGNILLCDLYIVYYTARLLLFKKTLPVEQAMHIVSGASSN